MTMKEIMDIVHSPLGGAIAAVVASAAVRALPEPPAEHGSMFYRWLYNFTHGILANFDKVGAKK